MKNGLLISLLLFLLGSAWGQSSEYIGVEDGLSQGLVSASLQDAEGFLWFGTASGLNRYDGRNFKTFYRNPFDSTSLRSNKILALADGEDHLLIGTEVGGLDAYHKKRGTFYEVRNRITDDSLGLDQLRVSRLVNTGAKGWFGLFSTPQAVSYFIQFQLTEGEDGRLVTKQARTILADADVGNVSLGPDSNFLYIGRPDHLLRVDLRAQPISFLKIPCPAGLVGGNFTIDKNGEIWIISNKLLGCWSEGEWRIWKTDFSGITLGVITDQNLVVPTEDNRLLTFSLPLPTTDVLPAATVTHQEALAFARVRTPILDSSDNLWFGSSGRGLLKIDPRKKRFTTLLKGSSLRHHLNFDAAGNLLAQAKTNHYLVIAKDKNKASITEEKPGALRLAIDDKGTEWRTQRTASGWTLYRKKNNEQRELIFSYRLPHLTADQIRKGMTDLVIAPSGHLWIAGEGFLYQYIQGQAAPSVYPFPSAFSAPHQTMDLEITPDGGVWVATTLGLLRAVVVDDSVTFSTYHEEAVYEEGLQNNKLSGVLKDPEDPNVLWVSSLGGGISQLAIDRGTFTHWNRQSGELVDDNVYGLLSDDAGNIWWSSNQGLSRYQPTTKQFNHFNTSDGLPGNEFNQLAYAKDATGNLYFGGVEGLVTFNPSTITPNPHTPLTRLVDLKVNGDPWATLPDKNTEINDPAFLTEIALPYDQNNLELTFAGLEYSATDKQKFKFFLAGAEEEWGAPTSQNQVSYLNLQPGRYTFRVVAANGDGIWHEEATELNIRIFPPWWRTTGAYLVYGLLALLLAAGTTYYLLRRQSYRFRLQLQQKETEQLQELHRFRASLYQSVTHEFRSPLSVINSVAREWLQRNAGATNKREANTVLRSSQRMLNQVDRMLNVATVEKDKLPYHARMGDVAAYLIQMVEERRSTFVAASLNLTVSTEPASFITAFDPYYLDTILGNLLDNALKYSGKGSAVELGFNLGEDENTMVFMVKDDGAGIAPDLLPRIFERNVRTDSQQEQGRGFGIGLAYVKELVDRLDGEIEVESKLAQGSNFTVRLPIEQRDDDLLPLVEELPTASVALDDIQEVATGEKKRLLVVEDNDELRQFLYSSLSKHFSVLTANNGEAGSALARQEVPDLIISDLVMPKLDGLQLVNQLKNDERTSHIPIILLTSKTGLENRLKGLSRGANVYLGKPFDLRELRLHLKNLLEQQERASKQYLQLSTATASAPTLPSEDPEQRFLQKVRKIVLEHLDDESFKVPDLAKQLSVSRGQLHNKLKALTGLSTSLYIRRLRLAEARSLLEQNELSISEVAYATGFKYAHHFSRYYAEIYQEPPSETRDRGDASKK